MDKGVDYMTFDVTPFEFNVRSKPVKMGYNEKYRLGSGFDVENE